jgi:hypothetical protein
MEKGLKKLVLRNWIHMTQGPVAGFCEHGNEPLDSTKGEEFLDQLSSYQFIHRVQISLMGKNIPFPKERFIKVYGRRGG